MSTKDYNLIENFKRENIEENMFLYDKSIVLINPEKPEKTAFKCLLNSLFNNMVMTCAKLIMMINLILIGHYYYEAKIHFQLFIIFQIGVFILEFLGKSFILGLIKYIFIENNDFKNSYNLYIRLKTALVFLVPIIFIPISIGSYFLIGLFLKYGLNIYEQNITKEVFKQFLIFTPVIYLFETLFFLNVKYLYMKIKYKIFGFVCAFLICHICTSFILIFIFDKGLLGLTLSYGFNSFIYFFFTDRLLIANKPKGCDDNYFFLIPTKDNFDCEILKILGQTSIYSLINLGDIIVPSAIFLASIFIDKNVLIVNIIYLNFFELLIELNRGFYYSIKRDIIIKYDDARERQMILTFFGLYYLILCLAIIITLLIFKNILLNIYLIHGGELLFQEISGNLKVIYPICIFCMSLRLLLNGIIRGMNLPLSYLRKGVYMILSIMCCYILCFEFDCGIRGLWISMLVFDGLYVCESAHKTIKHFPLVFNYSSRIDV